MKIAAVALAAAEKDAWEWNSGTTIAVALLVCAVLFGIWNFVWFAAWNRRIGKPWGELLDYWVSHMESHDVCLKSSLAYRQASKHFDIFMNPKWLFASDESLGIPNWKSQVNTEDA